MVPRSSFTPRLFFWNLGWLVITVSLWWTPETCCWYTFSFFFITVSDTTRWIGSKGHDEIFTVMFALRCTCPNNRVNTTWWKRVLNNFLSSHPSQHITGRAERQLLQYYVLQISTCIPAWLITMIMILACLCISKHYVAYCDKAELG